ncbi:PCYCGC motif-containing (lipo)protein [Halalkalibacterium ligniniphilum]|uniref:PCYCGC motif-containing (lipo)protein n=1 Tax=Halalkalibacterium ligniniphilum TaxID=1134413 RepID=UPI00034DDB59|nr:PCYCGC motif-containing (lipo)protein [Halalkalibacterium ligniniphilum]
MNKLAILVLLFGFMIPISGCQNAQVTEEEEHDGHHSMMMGDIQETTASAEVLPTFLDDYHESITPIYERVPHYQDLLETMPCYCGCGESVGHRSSYDCFVHAQTEDGEITWDDHGAKCGVCLEIAHASMNLYDEGMSPQDIRQLIDKTYSEGYAPPTATPMPEDV